MDWGCSQTAEGSWDNAPKSVEDCFDLATSRHPQGSPEWYDAYDKCIQAGCAAGTIPDCN